jgi:hypothetical protein
MNRLAPLFIATTLMLSGAALAQDDSATAPADPSAPPDASQGQPTQPKGFVVIQRNIYVPVDSEGKVASQKWIVIDKQGFVTAEELEAAQREQGTADGSEDEGSGASGGDGNSNNEDATTSMQGRPGVGEGPMIRS